MLVWLLLHVFFVCFCYIILYNVSDIKLTFTYFFVSSRVSAHPSASLTTAPIWLSDLRCVGTESDVMFCGNVNWDNNTCGHDQDVFLSCGKILMTIQSYI